MEDAGQRLKRRREELDLRYRDVEAASIAIAERHKNEEFTIVISRLAEIENRGSIPSLYKLYSLCAIYRLDLVEVLEWYGVNLAQMPADSSVVKPPRTHSIGFSADLNGDVPFPLTLDPGMDITRTTFLSRMIQRWGRMPLLLLAASDPKTYRYAWVGMDDASMSPIIQPGSLLLIDETRRKVQNNGWTSLEDRPIYLLETRRNCMIGWCTQTDKVLIVTAHPSSESPAQVFTPDEIDVLGQVVGLATRLEPRRRSAGKG